MIERHPSVDPVHPGEILREDVLPALAMSKTAVADALGISRQTEKKRCRIHRARLARRPVRCAPYSIE